MKILNDYVINHARCKSPDIVMVDGFLNHKIDTYLMKKIGEEFADMFCSHMPDVVMTLEASGIPPALATAFSLGVPLVFAKKHKGPTGKLDDAVRICADVVSFTGGTINKIYINNKHIGKGDRVLIIDDFLATGAATCGMIDICNTAGALIVGVGAVIEKVQQGGYHTVISKIDDMQNQTAFSGVKSLCKVKINTDTNTLMVV